jgi:predicted O-linked N-acetylglucosamine transferase (SPINDLY family)
MSMATIPEALQIALQHHQAGQLQDAEALYRQILQVQPQHPDALHLLGVLAHQGGQHEVAVRYIERAIACDPQVAAFHNNLGEVYRAMGQLPDAIAHYRRALGLQPAYPEAHYNLGNALRDQGNLAEAVASYEKALALRPGYAEAHNNLGVTLKEQGRLGEAVAQYKKALAHISDSAEVYSNLGVALQEQGEFQEAVTYHQKALACRPGSADLHNNLGNAFQAQGLLEDAVTYYRQALALKPDYVEAHGNLAFALIQQGKHEEGVARFRQALALQPDNAGTHSKLLFCMTYSTADPGIMAQEYKKWDEMHAAALAAQIKSHENDSDPERRLRVGYVSGDFRWHAANYFFEPVLTEHDRGRVEVFCYSNGLRSDATTERLRALTDAWRNIAGLSDEAVANRIRADRIDILVDLSNHTAYNRLMVFARKPAPVQVAYLWFGPTTGLSAMDYKLVDRWFVPDGSPEWFSEELISLPRCVVCYRPPEEAPPVASSAATKTRCITFGCFNRLAKVTPEVVHLWASILMAVPEARLLLKDKTLADPAQRLRYQGLFVAQGIDSRRIKCLPQSPFTEYLATYGRLDIALDPFPYSGCTTTCEALWMGVPVITLAGVMSHSRVGVSILSSLGLENLIAPTRAAYVEKAVELASDREALARLRAELRPRMAESTVCDARGLAREVEKAYRRMWHRWCQTGATTLAG